MTDLDDPCETSFFVEFFSFAMKSCVGDVHLFYARSQSVAISSRAEIAACLCRSQLAETTILIVTPDVVLC